MRASFVIILTRDRESVERDYKRVEFSRVEKFRSAFNHAPVLHKRFVSHALHKKQILCFGPTPNTKLPTVDQNQPIRSSKPADTAISFCGCEKLPKRFKSNLIRLLWPIFLFKTQELVVIFPHGQMSRVSRAGRVVLNNLNKEIRECYRHAQDCALKATAHIDAHLKQDFLDLEQRWLFLARSYEFSERLTDLSDEIKRRADKSPKS